MNLSIYTRGFPRVEHEFGYVLDQVEGVDDVDLIQLSLKHDKPALVNYAGVEAIVKKVEPLDDSHSFIELFDIAISVADLRRMEANDLPTPEKPLADYDCEVEITIKGKIPLNVMLRARENYELQAQFRRLIATDPKFREAVQQCILDDITCHDHVEMECRVVASHIQPGKPEPDSPEWDIIT